MFKIFKSIFLFVFLFTMVGFEVSRDLLMVCKGSISENVVLNDVSEDDTAEKETKTVEKAELEIDADIHAIRYASFVRESIRLDIAIAHDLNYQLLEQKVTSPPPEFCFS